MSVTRADVLVALRIRARPTSAYELARVMDAPSYRINKSLTGLYARDLIDRTRVFGSRVKYLYVAKPVHA